MTSQDQDHLNILSIFHFIVGGVVGLTSLFPVIHLIVGLSLVAGSFSDPELGSGGPPMTLFGMLFVLVALVLIVAGLGLAGCIVATGVFLRQQRNHTFCVVVAGVECIFMPLGTVLGVFTIIVLMRETVKRAFGKAPD
jgi:hypothetical protein